ncbi:hypothetical protein [Cyclobacterium sp.]|uniref:hypothetical protein n=1 Tax=Cyclobacterium sp. TaxID=1966343 RepID=UPI0019855B36|nr:hypothetical protein [Cyclobacterium sp.]MBD3631284.1 hypothetical protein [Cyclobacterium sp.]
MKDYSKIKSIVKVFKRYGIEEPSKVREALFEKDLNFDKEFVGGLIFDVEEALSLSLNQDEVDLLQNPNDVFKYMLSKSSMS